MKCSHLWLELQALGSTQPWCPLPCHVELQVSGLRVHKSNQGDAGASPGRLCCTQQRGRQLAAAGVSSGHCCRQTKQVLARVCAGDRQQTLGLELSSSGPAAVPFAISVLACSCCGTCRSVLLWCRAQEVFWGSVTCSCYPAWRTPGAGKWKASEPSGTAVLSAAACWRNGLQGWQQRCPRWWAKGWVLGVRGHCLVSFLAS